MCLYVKPFEFKILTKRSPSSLHQKLCLYLQSRLAVNFRSVGFFGHIQVCLYLQGFLGGFAGSDCNEIWSGHAAETLQMETALYGNRGHGIVL